MKAGDAIDRKRLHLPFDLGRGDQNQPEALPQPNENSGAMEVDSRQQSNTLSEQSRQVEAPPVGGREPNQIGNLDDQQIPVYQVSRVDAHFDSEEARQAVHEICGHQVTQQEINVADNRATQC